MRPTTLLRLAFTGGRADAMRIALTTVSAALAVIAAMAAATVLSIKGGQTSDGSPGWTIRYSSPLLYEPGLRPGVAFGLLLLVIPVLGLAAQCSRLGAPARERRLAGYPIPQGAYWRAIDTAKDLTEAAKELGAHASG